MTLTFEVRNAGAETQARLCIREPDGVLRHDEVVPLDTAGTHTFRVALPAGAFGVSAKAGNAAAGGSVGYDVEMPPCAELVLYGNFSNLVIGFAAAGGIAQCLRYAPPASGNASVQPPPSTTTPPQSFPPVSRPIGTPAANKLDLIPVQDNRAWALGSIAMSLLSLALWKWEGARWLMLGLFSRLVRHRVLDQGTRSQVHELVHTSPGIHAHRIAKQLGMGNGATAYHLRVLMHHGLIVAVRRGGIRSFFPAGGQSPQELLAKAALQTESVARLYQSSLARPGDSLRNLANRAGLTLPTASKALRRLVDAQLVERKGHGRGMTIRPAALPAPK